MSRIFDTLFHRAVLILAFVLWPVAVEAGSVSFSVQSEDGDALPCRIHLTDSQGNAHHPPATPFWRGGFVCDGSAELELPAGTYRYEIERGPEWSAESGKVVVGDQPAALALKLRRIADLKAEGWFSGDLHVHRTPAELPQHLRAEDLSVASVQTWWNKKNLWAGRRAPEPVKEIGGRYYHVVGGEDERGGGALLFHRMTAPIDITAAKREWPASVTYLEEAKRAGGWIEIEKPFWWDTPLWLSTGKIDSIGIAQNHMNRSGVLATEAWGRPRDRTRFPGVHGNGYYTQDLYYKILNAGLRIPPSAGSASGVLPNPVGYNRVYVHTGAKLGWDQWWKGLREGRSFVTNGPLLRLNANSTPPGTVVKSDRSIEVTIAGKLDSRDPIAKIELVHDGQIREVSLPLTFTVERSGWFLVRAIANVENTFRFASTAPWYAEIGDEPMKPDREAASFFLTWAKQRRAMLEQAVADPLRRAEVLAAHQRGIDFWQQIASAAR